VIAARLRPLAARPARRAPKHAPLRPSTEYLVRTVRIGIQATVPVLLCLLVFPALPGHGRIRLGAYGVMVGAGALGAVAVTLLPWRHLFDRRLGVPALYAWSAFDIALITGGIAVTGGGRSEIWLLYALTTLFFAASYPRKAQLALLGATLVAYVTVIAATGWSIGAAQLFLHVSVLCVVCLLASFLSGELVRETAAHRAASVESERRAVLLERLNTQLVRAQEEERTRVARELHDDLGQILTSIALFTRRIESEASPRHHTRLAMVRGLAERAVARVRELSWRLSPVDLDEVGLAVAVARSAAGIGELHGLRVDVHCHGLERRLPPEIETAAYRIVQEALTNAIRHSEARSVSVVLVRQPKAFIAVVADDGRGFDPRSAEAGETGQSVGLLSMRERARGVGGELAIESAPSSGTTVRLRVPMSAEAARRSAA
jgi:signal transduction histidine kinase